jgi:hypothetical protein
MKRIARISTVLIIVSFLLQGCETLSQLGKTKDHWADNDYEWIAKQDISCKVSDEGCNQLHLMKGDACYRLAKDGKDVTKNYQCAVTELETGIAQTKEWKLDSLDLSRAQSYENLCEAIRNLEDLETGLRAEEMSIKLLDTTRAFLAVEPGNLAGIYFLNSARYTLLRGCLIHPENCPGLCENLQAIEGQLNEAMPRAKGTNYRDNFHRLQRDIEGAKRSLSGCR